MLTPRRPWQRLPPDLVLPLASAAIFLLVFAVRFRDYLEVVYLNGDAASGPVIAELYPERDGSDVLLGDYRWIEPLYLLRLTAFLPAHRQVWQLLPLLLFGVAVLAATLSVWRIAGRDRALISLAALACPAPLVLSQLAVINAHGHTLVHAVLLATAVGLLAQLGPTQSTRRLVAITILLAVVTAPGVASDQLMLPAAIVPAIAVAAVLRRTGAIPTRTAIAITAAAIGAVVVAAGLGSWATSAGVQGTGRTFLLQSVEGITGLTRLMVEDLALMGHGTFGGEIELWPVAHYAMALVILASIVALARRLRATGRTGFCERSPEAQAALTFWIVAVILLGLAFLSTTAPVDTSSVRYLLPVWPALVILAAVVVPAGSGVRILAAVVTAAAVLPTADLVRGTYTDAPTALVTESEASLLRQFVASRDLDHGYAAYWTAANVTYQTRFAVRTYPVLPVCHGPHRGTARTSCTGSPPGTSPSRGSGRST